MSPPLPARKDEIGLLHQGFLHMGERLRQSRQDVVKAERQVWHAERLAAIGRLAAGLAHEINNPINGVRNCIYALKAEPDNRQQTEEYLQMMDEGLSQASGVIEKLLGFSRKQQTQKAALDLNEAVDSVARLVQFKLGRKNIKLDISLQDDLSVVLADRQLIQEVIMNLMLNAADAVDGGGHIQVRTFDQSQDVVLQVQDDGQGIAGDHLEQVFDPFFTTKNTGEGTGLGLSICLGIVQAHGGTLDVQSDDETIFTMVLPRLNEKEQEVLHENPAG